MEYLNMPFSLPCSNFPFSFFFFFSSSSSLNNDEILQDLAAGFGQWRDLFKASLLYCHSFFYKSFLLQREDLLHSVSRTNYAIGTTFIIKTVTYFLTYQLPLNGTKEPSICWLFGGSTLCTFSSPFCVIWQQTVSRICIFHYNHFWDPHPLSHLTQKTVPTYLNWYCLWLLCMLLQLLLLLLLN